MEEEELPSSSSDDGVGSNHDGNGGPSGDSKNSSSNSGDGGFGSTRSNNSVTRTACSTNDGAPAPKRRRLFAP